MPFSPVVFIFTNPPRIVIEGSIVVSVNESYDVVIPSSTVFIVISPASINMLPLPQSIPSPDAFTVMAGAEFFVRPTRNMSFVLKPSFAAALMFMFPLLMRI